jgi:hypothetical protein
VARKSHLGGAASVVVRVCFISGEQTPSRYSVLSEAPADCRFAHFKRHKREIHCAPLMQIIIVSCHKMISIKPPTQIHPKRLKSETYILHANPFVSYEARRLCKLITVDTLSLYYNENEQRTKHKRI